jgi:hypothetical protein
MSITCEKEMRLYRNENLLDSGLPRCIPDLAGTGRDEAIRTPTVHTGSAKVAFGARRFSSRGVSESVDPDMFVRSTQCGRV